MRSRIAVQGKRAERQITAWKQDDAAEKWINYGVARNKPAQGGMVLDCVLVKTELDRLPLWKCCKPVRAEK